MRNKYFKIILLLVISLITINIFAQRFPAPEFDTDYKVPDTQVTHVKPIIYEIIDIVVFLGLLAFVTYVVIKKRSRKAVFWISVFSILYFGFYREGCICSIGAIQNVTMAIFNSDYTTHSYNIFYCTIGCYIILRPHFLCRCLSAWRNTGFGGFSSN